MGKGMKKSLITFIGLAVVVFLVGCTTAQKGAGVGAVAGSVIGGVIGHQSGHGAAGAGIGAAVGAAGGALVGEQMDTQFCPICGANYTSDVKFCPKDGSELKQKQK